jgi:hypothetical protein
MKYFTNKIVINSVNLFQICLIEEPLLKTLEKKLLSFKLEVKISQLSFI